MSNGEHVGNPQPHGKCETHTASAETYTRNCRTSALLCHGDGQGVCGRTSKQHRPRQLVPENHGAGPCRSPWACQLASGGDGGEEAVEGGAGGGTGTGAFGAVLGEVRVGSNSEADSSSCNQRAHRRHKVW